MKIATILFTYNRSQHTQKVIEALSRNTILPEKLYIFQDGLRQESHREEWEKVNTLIHNVSFCPVELVISKENKGVAKSVLDGINYVFESNDAVIVIEDDCVTMPGFMKFITDSLQYYSEEEQVYCVSGYAYPIDLTSCETDAYFCGRTSSWGWGTWKSRWSSYDGTDMSLRTIMNNSDLSKELAIWGRDLECMLQAALKGKIDAWDVYWALGVIKNAGYCLNPYISYVQNIGFDNSGTHCTCDNKYYCEKLQDEVKEKYVFPEKMEFAIETKKAFAKFFGSSMVFSEYDAEKQDALVYGLGNYFRENEPKIVNRYNIVGIVDQYKSGWFAGKKILAPSEITLVDYDVIIIAIYDEAEREKNVMKLEKEYGVTRDRIRYI